MESVNGVVVIGAAESRAVQAEAAAAAAAAAAKRAQSLGLHTISHSGVTPPLDFSFQDITSMAELASHEPAGGRKPAAASASASASASAAVGSPKSSADAAKRVGPKTSVTGVRLAYNELTSLAGFVEAMELLLGPNARTQLTWLDLSHNKLTTVDDCLLLFPNLTALYLHGNAISSIHEVRKLHTLTQLAKLTVHGNPLYQEKLNHGLRNPRSAVIYHLRNCELKSLDFITITNGDRRNSLRWAEQNKPKKKRPVTEDDEHDGSPTRR